MRLTGLTRVLLTTLAFLVGGANAQEFEKQLTDFVSIARSVTRTEKTDAEKSAEVEAAFAKRFALSFAPADLKKYTDADLGMLFEANSEAVFVAREPRYANNMAALLGELEIRRKASARQYAELFKSFVRTRQFALASELAARKVLDSPPSLPEFRYGVDLAPGVPAEWVIAALGRVAELRAVDLSRDWQVVVVSHPNCRFSRNAMESINADNELRQLLEGRTSWVTPQDGSFEFDALQQWNSMFPKMQISVVHLSKDWPLTNFSATPVFYFLAKGKVVTSFSGWPKEGNKIALHDALKLVRQLR
ncbi:MAG: hypothetical protein ACK5UX_15295 [Burkholderiales bacterium]